MAVFALVGAHKVVELGKQIVQCLILGLSYLYFRYFETLSSWFQLWRLVIFIRILINTFVAKNRRISEKNIYNNFKVVTK